MTARKAAAMALRCARSQRSLEDKPSMPDRVRVSPGGAFRRLAGNGPYSASWRVPAAPILSSERYHTRSVLTKPLAHASANRDDFSCSRACLSDARLSKHLGR
jgi:hypothetical protein